MVVTWNVIVSYDEYWVFYIKFDMYILHVLSYSLSSELFIFDMTLAVCVYIAMALSMSGIWSGGRTATHWLKSHGI